MASVSQVWRIFLFLAIFYSFYRFRTLLPPSCIEGNSETCLLFGFHEHLNLIGVTRSSLQECCWGFAKAFQYCLFAGTGVTTDRQTQWASWIMIATLLPYLVAQIPRLFGLKTGGHLCIAIAAFISVGGLVAYCTYQVLDGHYSSWFTCNWFGSCHLFQVLSLYNILVMFCLWDLVVTSPD